MKSIRNKLVFAYNLALIIAAIILYFTIPILLNYGEGTVNTAFDKEISGGLYYYQQILLIVAVISLLLTGALCYVLRDIDKFKLYKQKWEETHDVFYKNKLIRIKKTCFSLPNIWYFTFMLVPVFIAAIMLLSQTYISITDLKLLFILLIVATLSLSIANIYVKKLLNKVLVGLENTEFIGKKRSGMMIKILSQLGPIITICILFTFLVVSSAYEKSKAVLLKDYYDFQFETLEITNTDDLIKSLQGIQLSKEDDILFLMDPSGDYIYQTGEISDFFKKYSRELSPLYDYTVYGYYGTYIQGVIYPIELNGETWYIGAHYSICSDEVYMFIFLLLICLYALNLGLVWYFSYNLTQEIKTVANSLKGISTNKDLYHELYITSEDELGELVAQYNKVRLMTKDNIDQIHNSQDILIEKERLATLGQMIGGIAHNLKTPIMSISGATEALTDLTNEYDSSIGDKSVTDEDHHEIAKDMHGWLDKTRTHLSYMSDIITAVKGQAVNFSATEPTQFTVYELLKQVNILMKHELKNALIYLNIQCSVDENMQLVGNINSLVQVINNMISNAIQSYNGKPDNKIDLHIYNSNDKLIITIKDYGCGMTQEVQDKLFNSMITTKGKNGTGLGLFMSYSNIKAHFNGDIKFESEVGKGSTFYIILPFKA